MVKLERLVVLWYKEPAINQNRNSLIADWSVALSDVLTGRLNFSRFEKVYFDGNHFAVSYCRRKECIKKITRTLTQESA